MPELLAGYCVIIVGASVAGGWLPTVVAMNHLRTQLLMSFVAGLMLGIGMLHMLPHATYLLGSPVQAGGAALAGIIAMFILLRAFHTHAHGTADADHHTHEHHHDSVRQSHAASARSATEHDRYRDSGDTHADTPPGRLPLSWLGMLLGLGLHTLMDGVALAASVVAESGHRPWLGLAGLGTFLAVALHKPLDAFAITSVMRRGGWSAAYQSLANVGFALACPIGASLFFLGASCAPDSSLLGWGLAVSAGFFICISLSDLLPEVTFHDHDRVGLTAALFLGVALAVTIESLPGHSSYHEGGLAPRTTATDVLPCEAGPVGAERSDVRTNDVPGPTSSRSSIPDLSTGFDS